LIAQANRIGMVHGELNKRTAAEAGKTVPLQAARAWLRADSKGRGLLDLAAVALPPAGT
jgi:hypothetical protein